MSTILAFDVYNTLIDTAGVFELLKIFTPEKSLVFMDTWRKKQLEYSFRRGLMRNYVNFSECTKSALDYTCELLKCELLSEERKQLMQKYKALPAFPDVHDGLEELQATGFLLFAFSNGKTIEVKEVLEHARIMDFFEDVISVDDIRTFKPDPECYTYLLSRTKSLKSDTWLISGNPFDIIGAVSTGLKAAWIKRSPDAVFDPWEIEPDAIVNQVSDLNTVIK